ncbi:MAG: GEGP motif-containing diheme protein [bacterium]
MTRKIVLICCIVAALLVSSTAFSAYHHEGEMDSDNFLAAYPEKTGTKLDHCALCHSGGTYIDAKSQEVSLGSCQWCHYSYGYDGSGNIAYTLNNFGKDYYFNGRDALAIGKIDNFDSDGDGYSNKAEIQADRFPGNAKDDPSKKIAPSRVYTRADLEAMPQHTQFLLMNTSRSGDFYAEYSGVSMEYLLEDAGISDSATGILVYAPDGWSNYHPLDAEPDPELYHVNGVYPAASFHYDEEADEAQSAIGWCDYSAPSRAGRNNNDPIYVEGGLRMILAVKREGVDLDEGALTDENKLDGEGPFRLVPPQKNPGPPDQSSRAANQDVIWPFNWDWDHNAGASSRTVTIIKVLPLPPGTTDIDVLEAGWQFVDQEKIIIYGAIDDPNAPETGGGGSTTPPRSSYSLFGGLFPYGGYSTIPGVYSFGPAYAGSGIAGINLGMYPSYGYAGIIPSTGAYQGSFIPGMTFGGIPGAYSMGSSYGTLFGNVRSPYLSMPWSTFGNTLGTYQFGTLRWNQFFGSSPLSLYSF